MIRVFAGSALLALQLAGGLPGPELMGATRANYPAVTPRESAPAPTRETPREEMEPAAEPTPEPAEESGRGRFRSLRDFRAELFANGDGGSRFAREFVEESPEEFRKLGGATDQSEVAFWKHYLAGEAGPAGDDVSWPVEVAALARKEGRIEIEVFCYWTQIAVAAARSGGDLGSTRPLQEAMLQALAKPGVDPATRLRLLLVQPFTNPVLRDRSVALDAKIPGAAIAAHLTYANRRFEEVSREGYFLSDVQAEMSDVAHSLHVALAGLRRGSRDAGLLFDALAKRAVVADTLFDVATRDLCAQEALALLEALDETELAVAKSPQNAIVVVSKSANAAGSTLRTLVARRGGTVLTPTLLEVSAVPGEGDEEFDVTRFLEGTLAAYAAAAEWALPKTEGQTTPEMLRAPIQRMREHIEALERPEGRRKEVEEKMESGMTRQQAERMVEDSLTISRITLRQFEAAEGQAESAAPQMRPEQIEAARVELRRRLVFEPARWSLAQKRAPGQMEEAISKDIGALRELMGGARSKSDEAGTSPDSPQTNPFAALRGVVEGLMGPLDDVGGMRNTLVARTAEEAFEIREAGLEDSWMRRRRVWSAIRNPELAPQLQEWRQAEEAKVATAMDSVASARGSSDAEILAGMKRLEDAADQAADAYAALTGPIRVEQRTLAELARDLPVGTIYFAYESRQNSEVAYGVQDLLICVLYRPVSGVPRHAVFLTQFHPLLVETLANRFALEVGGPASEEFVAGGRAVARRLFPAEVRPWLREARSVAIAPAQATWKLPHEALVLETKEGIPEFLGLSKPIYTVTGLAALRECSRPWEHEGSGAGTAATATQAPAPVSAVVVGIGDFAWVGNVPQAGAWLGPNLRLDPLPQAVPDAAAVAKVHGVSLSQGTPTLAQWRGASFIHLATHGFPGWNADQFGMQGRSHRAFPFLGVMIEGTQGVWLPLSADAGATPSLRDGLLQAWEVEAMAPLQADAVFLSACDTGRGGWLSPELPGAFLRAGARSIVATRTCIRDATAIVAAEAFHRAYRAGKSKDEALLEARRAMFAKDPAPAAWATYYLMGSPVNLLYGAAAGTGGNAR